MVGSETSGKHPVTGQKVRVCGSGEGAGRQVRGTRTQGLPSQQPTYLTPGEQRREAADGLQGQVQILHHRGCVGREGPVTRGPALGKLQGGRQRQVSWGHYLLC